MSKRKPDKQLNHENWDDEDVPEEIGSFQKACADTLKGRVIKQAKRRITNNSTTESEPKSMFAGFSGFVNQPESKKSFFNSNLTNTSTTTTSNQPYKFSFISNSAPSANSDSKSSEKVANLANDVVQTIPKRTDSPFSSSLSTKSSESESVKTNKLKELSAELQKSGSSVTSDSNKPTTPDEIFLQKLRSLNLLCAEWIIKHLNENWSYILTPIFDDYQKYLNKLKEERQRNTSTAKKVKLETTSTSTFTTPSFLQAPKPASSSSLTSTNSLFKAPDFKSSFSKVSSFSSLPPQEPPCYAFPEPPSENAPSFNFFKSSNKDESEKAKGDSGLFKFSAPPKPAETPNAAQKPLFSFSSGSSSTLNGTLFSPMANNPLVSKQQATDEVDTKEDEDATPPVVSEAITEEGSVYEKKCKVFIKKDGAFVDHGVGFIFLKLVGDEKKCQMIVRANNKLATIMLNVLLSSSIPIQLMGKNNVMLVCCPTPDSKPSSVLLRVKSTQDAEELLNKLNELRK